jgi:hypothetical protein
MIQLRWSNQGPKGEENAYGTIYTKEGSVVICSHGGSQWLCRSCAEEIRKLNPDWLKKTPDWLRKEE